MHCDPSTILARYTPISLATMDAVAELQTRRDNKYIIPWNLFEEWQRSLQPTHRALDIRGTRVFTYDTQYFDTPSLGLYRAHLQRQRKQFKTRSRHYVESGSCVFEIKLKNGRGETVKRKIEYDATRLNVVTQEAAAFVQACLDTHYEQVFDEQLVPTVRTLYRRATLVAVRSSERITCDFALTFERDEGSQARLRPDHVLVEIKSAKGRGASDRLLWDLGARPMSGSKYCTGIGMLWPDTRNNVYRRQIRRFFVPPDAIDTPRRVMSRDHLSRRAAI